MTAKETKSESSINVPTKWYLYTVAFVGGAAVLALEILGTRVLGPFYGTTIYLWSALITVTLLALSIGYALGGRLADRFPTITFLCILLLGAGCFIILIPWIKKPILTLIEPFGLRLAVLVAALILFSVPLTLLGMISPLVLRIKAKRLTDVGSTAGGLYAISTIGSVVAALATGYWLIPSIGVNRLMFLIGLALIVTALFGLVARKSTAMKTLSILPILIAGGVIAWSIPAGAALPMQGLMLVKDSEYGEIRIVDKPPIRYLLVDGLSQNLADLRTWMSYHYCMSVMEILTSFKEPPGDLLLIGLGAGSYAKSCAKDGWRIDAVEIDPEIINVAHKYFGLTPAEAATYCDDGRHFLNKSAKAYDVITLDAFGSGLIPFHLMTTEYFGLVKQHLKENGIVVINLISLVKDDPLMGPIIATVKTQFQEVWAFPVLNTATWTTNTELIVSDRPVKLPEKKMVIHRFDGVTLTPEVLWDKRFVPESQGAPVLTDDLNPADLWSERINHLLRKDLHENMAAHRLAW